MSMITPSKSAEMSVENVFLDAKGDSGEKIELALEENSPDELNEVGLTGVQICASNGCLNSSVVYLKHGASISHVDTESGWTALHRSIYGGHIKVSMLLTKAGAALDGEDAIRDKEGLTPMDLLSSKLSSGLNESRVNQKSSAVWSFGKSDFILGVPLPKASEVVQPRRIDNLAAECVVQTCASKYHSCALTSEGDVYTWGHGRSGRLGHGSEVGQPEPVLVDYFKLKRLSVKQIASGENHTIIVTRQGDVYTWGSDKLGQLGQGNALVSRAGAESDQHPKGEKGSALSDACSLVPKRVDALRREFVLEVAAGDGHSLCHTRDGSLYAWGSNKSGQLGLRPTELGVLPGGGQGVNIPKKVFVEALYRGRNGVSAGHSIPGRIMQIAASHNNSMLLCVSNATFSLVSNKLVKEVYQWGHGLFTPVRVVFKEKKARTFSLGDLGGRHVPEEANAFKPVGHSGLVSILQVAPGQHHFAGLSSDGCVYTWGVSSHASGFAAAIGPERLAERIDERVEGRESLSQPRLVEGLLSEQGGGWVVSIAAASNRLCAVTDAGNLYTWSIATQGKSTHEGDSVPRRVATVKRAVTVSAAVDHTLVVCSYSLPPLPLAEWPMFVDCCPQTGKPVRGAGEPVLQTEAHLEEGGDDEADSEGAGQDISSATPATQQPEEGRIIALSAEGPNKEEEEGNDFESDAEDENIPSLMNLCQREVAKSVTLKTVISALSFAEQFSAQLLVDYCHNYISINFDAVLAQSKQAEIDKYVDSWGFGDIYSTKARSGSTLLGPTNYSSKMKPSVTGAPKQDNSSSKSSTRDTNKKELPTTAEDVRKQMRGTKKKLGAIAELEGKIVNEVGFSLSTEQKEKISKKQELFAEYAHLEQLLVRCEARERAISGEASPSPPEPAAVQPLAPTPMQTTPSAGIATAPLTTLPRAGKVPATQETTPAKKVKSKGISLKEFNMIVESTGGKVPGNLSAEGRPAEAKSSPWGAKPSAQVHPQTVTAESQTRILSAPLTLPTQCNAIPSGQARKGPIGDTLISPVSTPTKQPIAAKAATSPALVTDLGAPRRTRALTDFLPSAKQAPPVTPPPAKLAGWAASPTPLPTTSKFTPPVVAVAKPVRFSDIQRIEESARKASSITALQGNSSPWYVERRQRADSLEEVVRQQAWDRAEEEEIARAVAEIDRIALLTENAAKAAASNAVGGNKKKNGGGERPRQSKKKPVLLEKK